MVITRKSLRDNVLNNICYEMDYLAEYLMLYIGKVPYQYHIIKLNNDNNEPHFY